MSKLAEIRLLYEAKIKETVPAPVFDNRDLDRVKSDIYLYRVLEHCQNNVQHAADMLYNIMVWRKANNTNDITEDSVDKDILRDGLYYTRGRDIDSCLLFIMNSKAYVKGQRDVEAVKKVFIYWLERLEREEGGKKITLFFDMDGCGINNMNLNLISYMINVLKSFYPNFINYIIIFQMPWILSAGFKIVKEMLPAPAIERLRIINKDKLKDLVAPEQALVSWGGKDSYEFKFLSEHRTVVTTEDDNYSPGELLKLKPPKTLLFNVEGRKITASLIITNMDEGIIAFKIRTTAPEKYWVRPNNGILAKHVSQRIEITAQPGFNIDSIEKDRFLIVAVNIPNLLTSQSELSKIWKSAGSHIDEYRLNCAKVEKITVDETKNINDNFIKLSNEYQKIHHRLDMLHTFQIVIFFLTLATCLLSYMVLNKVNCSNYKE
ncbi:unnamed protein product [Leptosia nina]|uniref:Motile sperm domain-containing protein 2 n=1 Tax=Leptosia nina TaxID=320188 RepID=A0AAV1K1J6_9NEOP